MCCWCCCAFNVMKSLRRCLLFSYIVMLIILMCCYVHFHLRLIGMKMDLYYYEFCCWCQICFKRKSWSALFQLMKTPWKTAVRVFAAGTF